MPVFQGIQPLSSRMIHASLGAMMALSVTADGVLAGEPSFEVEAQELPVGAGLPDGKPIDIAGFYSGMNGADAQAALTRFYQDKKTEPRFVTSKLRYAKDAFLIQGGPSYGSYAYEKYWDLISVLLSSNASGNQIVAISRGITFAPGTEPSTQSYRAAIEEKYGKPSRFKDSTGASNTITYTYEYSNGALNTSNDVVCFFEQRSIANGKRDPQRWNKQARYHLRPYLRHGKRCSAFLEITLEHPFENGIPNKKSVGTVSVEFIDLKRLLFTNNRDAQAQKELKEKAAASQDAGTGTPKL